MRPQAFFTEIGSLSHPYPFWVNYIRSHGLVLHMKQLPVCIQDFKTVRSEDYYFADKSMLIGQMLDQFRNGVFLYTRPRRFGKSMNLSMIDAFFNIKYRGNTWFDGLEISKHREYDRYKNAFPVVNIDFKGTGASDIQSYLRSVNNDVIKAFKEHPDILSWDKLTKDEEKLIDDLLMKKIVPEDLADSVAVLCGILERYYGSKAIVLIDEYDDAVNGIKDADLRQKIIVFLGTLLSSALKGNSSLQFGVVTGILQITKENIFSKVNNFYVNNVLSERYDEMFGFTDREVKQICADYGHPEKYEEAKEWYDGYRFGGADIYNPWSILNYVSEGFRAQPYWLHTGKSDIILDLISKDDTKLIDDLKILGSGGTVSENVAAKLTFGDLNKRSSVYSLMVVSGYLKAVPGVVNYRLSIPNKELFEVFLYAVANDVFGDDENEGLVAGYLAEFSKAVMSNNTEAMKKSLTNIFKGNVSSRVLISENSYQAFITALLMCLFGNYDVKADYENGRGFSDIMMLKKKGSGPNVVIELKKSADDRHLERDAKAALEQIKDRDYAYGLRGYTILYGISFSHKELFVVSEESDYLS